MWGALVVLLMLSNFSVSTVSSGENNTAQRQATNAKYLKQKEDTIGTNKSLTCWQCAALPSMN